MERPSTVAPAVRHSLFASAKHFGVRLFAGLALSFPVAVQAAIVTQYFSGSTNFVSPEVASEFSLGEAYSGYFKYDSSGAPADMTPYCGTPTCSSYQFYFNTVPIEMKVTIGGDTYFSNMSSTAQITDTGQYALNFKNLAGPNANGLSPSYSAFVTNGLPTGGTFAWPENGFTDPGYQNSYVTLLFYDPSCCYAGFGGTVELTSAPVPEPMTTSLLGLGLLALVAARRNKANSI